MNSESTGAVTPEKSRIAWWRGMLRDEATLLAMPAAHHKALLRQAHALHKKHVFDAEFAHTLPRIAVYRRFSRDKPRHGVSA